MKKTQELYLRAVNSPLRRQILGVLNEGNSTIAELGAKTRLDVTTLMCHLNVSESGLCIEKENKQGDLIYKLTKYGRVIKYME